MSRISTRRLVYQSLIAALIVFVLGAALQRLGWERAVERYLHREKPPKEEKPAKTKPEKAKKPEKKAAPAAGEATDQLLSSMRIAPFSALYCSWQCPPASALPRRRHC